MADGIFQNDIGAFFQVPFHAYADTPYVSPMKSDLARFLNPRKNPLFERSEDLGVFTYHKQGRPVGRITAHVHRASNARHNENAAFFGYFDCIDDTEVSDALLAAAQDWAKTRNFDTLRGNFNLTAMQMVGVMTDGFDKRLYSDCMWSPPHIACDLERNGFERYFPMTTHALNLAEWTKRDAPAVLLPDGFTIAPMTRRQLDARLDDARQILNESFDQNPMFVPVTKAEYDFQAKDLKWVMDPRLSVVVHDAQGAAGALICIPDLNPMIRAMGARLTLAAPLHLIRHRLRNTSALLVYAGVRPDLQSQGVGPFMADYVARSAIAAGYRDMGYTWIADVNPASLRQMEKLGARRHQKLHLFQKNL